MNVLRNQLEVTFVFVVVFFLAFLCSWVFPRLMITIEGRMFRFAASPFRSAILIAALSFAGSAAVVALTRVPVPRVQDEFSHLLAADTFAAGRLSNPTHPMWEHFQSFHILLRPTYVSQFPPGQGLILAVGRIVFGSPIVGVWLSGALACSAIYWMLLGWFRGRVAFTGALLCVCQIGVVTYWTQSYWGGMLAALGGALVFGSLPRLTRLTRRPKVRTTIILVAGLAVLSITRPLEGLFASLPALVYITARSIRNSSSRRLVLQRVGVPLIIGAFFILGGLAYYNLRQTGSPFVTAYQIYVQNYQSRPFPASDYLRELAIFRAHVLRPDASMNAEFMRLHGFEAPVIRLPSVISRLGIVWQFYVGILLSLPLMVAFFAPSRIPVLAVVTIASTLGALLIGWFWLLPHYPAPITGPIFLLITHGWRRLRVWRPHQRSGLLLARTVVATAIIVLVMRVHTAHSVFLHAKPSWADQRAAIVRQLGSATGSHLILVRYSVHHNFNYEWVYNNADIDRSQIVWARELDAQRNRLLTSYFRNRQVWLVEPDQPNPKLVPYTGSPQVSASDSPSNPEPSAALRGGESVRGR